VTPIEYTTSIPEVGVTHDEIIDVRSPSEFLEDHIPGAINIPVLNDAERIEVGRTYKQQNPLEARKLGAAYIAGNISRFLSTHWAKKDKSYRPYIYCWRGGQRSASLATILSAIGWRVTLLDGGYRTYRLQVLRGMNERLDAHRLILLGGLTGTGKTRIIHQLRM
jgi:tRNA 2-selenouridine synthase